MKLSKMQILLGIHLEELGCAKDEILYEYRFCDERRWRFDVCLPDLRLAIEINGGNWTGGHRRGKRQEDEYDKLNHAAMDGWRVFQWTNQQIADGRAKEFLGSIL